MLTKRLTLFGTLTVLIMILATILAFPQQTARAQAPLQADNMEKQACLSCHELLYYNHGIGKWYCLSERVGDCTSCHEGNPTSVQEDEAHTGLIVHPSRKDGAQCQQCHPQDAPAYIEKFDEIAGIKLVEVESTYLPDPAVQEAAYTFPSDLAEIYQEQVSPWIIAGLIFGFGLWFVMVAWTSRR